MNAAKLLVLLAVCAALAVTACAKHSGRGYPHGRDMGYSVDQGIKEMNALVEKTVQDPEKAKRVQAIVSDIVIEAKQVYQQNREFHRKLYELNASYEASPEDFTKILDEMNNNRMRAATRILAMRFKMKELLTAQEWKALTDGMNASRGRYGYGKEVPQRSGSGT